MADDPERFEDDEAAGEGGEEHQPRQGTAPSNGL